MTENKSLLVSRKGLYISFFSFCICMVVGIYIFSDTLKPNGYEYLYLLPMAYGIAILCFCFLYDQMRNIGIMAILILEGFRMVVTPLLMVWGEYESAMPYSVEKNIPMAIGLMVYELLVVCVVVAFSYKKDYRKYSTARFAVNSDMLKRVLLFLILFLVAVGIVYPNSMTSFKSILDFGSDSFTTWYGLGANRYSEGTIERILTTLFTMVFTWVRYLLPVAAIIWTRRHLGGGLGSIVISCVPIVLQMFFITATIMDSILCAFVLFIVLTKCYPKYKKTLITVAVISFLFVVGFYFISRFFVRYGLEGNIWAFISENAIAYAGGISNVAGMIDVPTDSKWETFFFNIYGAIPFNSTLFGLEGDKLAAVFNAANGRVDGQIPPTIGASWYYFGTLLAPVESAIYARLAIKYGSKAMFENNIWRYMAYVLTALMMVMGFTTYNSAIVLNYATTLLIPLLILCRYTDDTECKF